jgi:hypothetical protein
MYGAPSELNSLRRVVTIMQEKDLGDGFDPGPAARAINRPVFDYLANIGWPVVAYPGCADMQVKGGCLLGPEDEAAHPQRRLGLNVAEARTHHGFD